MPATSITLLHPGEMGAQIGRCLRSAGVRVLWVGAGRSAASRERARAAGLTELGSLQAALAESDYALSVAPPDRALQIAQQVATARFHGVFIDANAISPDTARRVGAVVSEAGAQFVDGGIIGRPPTAPGLCRLYLSGTRAGEVARLFHGSDLAAVVLDGAIGAASALKMCYAAWTKPSMLLAASIAALAQHEGVGAALTEEWRLSQPQVAGVLQQAGASARKAWRWIGEMQQIEATFGDANLPGGFAAAAAEICRRLQGFKDTESVSLEQIIAALNGARGDRCA